MTTLDDPHHLCPTCGQPLPADSARVQRAIEGALTGRPGFGGVEVVEGNDHDGDPIWSITVFVRRKSRHGADLLRGAQQVARATDDRRFPHIRLAHPKGR